MQASSDSPNFHTPFYGFNPIEEGFNVNEPLSKENISFEIELLTNTFRTLGEATKKPGQKIFYDQGNGTFHTSAKAASDFVEQYKSKDGSQGYMDQFLDFGAKVAQSAVRTYYKEGWPTTLKAFQNVEGEVLDSCRHITEVAQMEPSLARGDLERIRDKVCELSDQILTTNNSLENLKKTYESTPQALDVRQTIESFAKDVCEEIASTLRVLDDKIIELDHRKVELEEYAEDHLPTRDMQSEEEKEDEEPKLAGLTMPFNLTVEEEREDKEMSEAPSLASEPPASSQVESVSAEQQKEESVTEMQALPPPPVKISSLAIKQIKNFDVEGGSLKDVLDSITDDTLLNNTVRYVVSYWMAKKYPRGHNYPSSDNPDAKSVENIVIPGSKISFKKFLDGLNLARVERLKTCLVNYKYTFRS